jgi:hypothetical protein
MLQSGQTLGRYRFRVWRTFLWLVVPFSSSAALRWIASLGARRAGPWDQDQTRIGSTRDLRPT